MTGLKKNLACRLQIQLFGVFVYLVERRVKPQCVVCSKVLTSESTLPNKHHFTSSHPQFVKKSGSSFPREVMI